MRRLASLNLQNSNGPVARSKSLFGALNIEWGGNLDFSWGNEQVTLRPDSRDAILHRVRDGLRRREWVKASNRRTDMRGIEEMDYERSALLWRKKKLERHLQRLLELVLSGAVWTLERKFRHTNGALAESPICTFCQTGEEETIEHLYWRCPRWSDIRRLYPRGKHIGLTTLAVPTRMCGLILKQESARHSKEAVEEMQTMMASILKQRFEEGKITETPPPDTNPVENTTQRDVNFRPHDFDIYRLVGGQITYRCLRCYKHRSHTTAALASEHCNGAPPTRGRNVRGLR